MKTNKLPAVVAGLLLAITISIPILTFSGCGTARPTAQAVAYHTLKDTQIAVDKAMTFYGDQCALGKVSIESQERIDRAHAQYRTSFRQAVTLARFDYNALTPDNVQALANTILQFISQL